MVLSSKLSYGEIAHYEELLGIVNLLNVIYIENIKHKLIINMYIKQYIM